MASVIGGNNASTVCLLPCDGDEGGTVLVDEAVGQGSRVINLIAGAVTSRAESVFGGASLLCHGGGAHVTIDPTADFNLGSSDFTIDCWVYVRDANAPYVFAWWQDGDNYLTLERVTTKGGDVRFQLVYRLAGVTVFAITSASGTHITVLDTWTHIAVVRNGTDLSLYFDGIGYGSATLTGGTSPATINLSSWTLYLGKSVQAGDAGVLRHLDGYIDEFRVHKAAQWTAPFTPPDNAYTANWRKTCRGTSHVYASTSKRGRGLSNLVIRSYVKRARGTATVLASWTKRGRGASNVRSSISKVARGLSNIVLRSYTKRARGLSSVRASFSKTARGTHRMDLVRYQKTARGIATILAPWTQRGRGTSSHLTPYQKTARGRSSIEDTSLDRYEFWHSVGSPPDLTAAPTETSAALPFTPAVVLTNSAINYFVLRKRNKHNGVSRNIVSTTIELDGAGNQISAVPSSPTETAITAASASTGRVTADYDYRRDAALAADTWLIYLTYDGSNPDPAVDTPTEVTISKSDGTAKLEYTTPGQVDSTTIKAIVRVKRTSDARESSNTNIVSVVTSTAGPASVTVEAFLEGAGVKV